MLLLKFWMKFKNLSNLSNVINAITSEIPDTIPPAAINDLQAESSETEIILSWTATGDDELEGIAYAYEIKVYDELITEDNWDDATLLPQSPRLRCLPVLSKIILISMQSRELFTFLLLKFWMMFLMFLLFQML